MRDLIFLLTLFTTQLTTAQVPRFEKFPMGESGCYAYFPGDPAFELSWSEDSSQVYTGEVVTDSFNYFGICVKLSESIGDNQREQLNLLETYLDYLQDAFGVTGSAGYGEGHTLEDYPAASGVIDYWEDVDGNSWAIKGWVNSQYLIVLGIYGEAEYPYFEAQQMYLNGVRFPGQ